MSDQYASAPTPAELQLARTLTAAANEVLAPVDPDKREHKIVNVRAIDLVTLAEAVTRQAE
jgi:hypothetical protein